LSPGIALKKELSADFQQQSNWLGAYTRPTDWFVDPDYLLSRLSDVVLIGFPETLQDDFNRLQTILRLPSEISLPCDPVVAHKTPPGFITDLDDQATANLRRWYAEDIQFYEFCRELRARRIAT